MKRFAAVLLVIVGIVGCGSEPTTIGASADTSIHGRLTAGPTCPVQRVGQACDDHPVKGATVLLRDNEGAVVAQTVSDADGKYTLAASSGRTYTVEPQRVAGVLEVPLPQTVAVPDGAGAAGIQVDFAYDTGIRN
jgi:hypothetical protein